METRFTLMFVMGDNYTSLVINVMMFLFSETIPLETRKQALNVNLDKGTDTGFQ